MAYSRHLGGRGMFRLDIFPMTSHLLFVNEDHPSKESKSLLKRIEKGVRANYLALFSGLRVLKVVLQIEISRWLLIRAGEIFLSS